VGAVYDANVGRRAWTACTDDTTAADKVTCFSNSASFLTMLAPGALITAAGSTYGGTSQAAPHVAGAAAVLRAAFPGETLNQTVNRMTANGIQVTDQRNGIQKPRLNLLAAVGGGPFAVPALSDYGVIAAVVVLVIVGWRNLSGIDRFKT
jgi:subtilisin family serine protease